MRRILLSLLVAGAVGGGIYGAAASLGGLTSDNLGAESSVVASCDTGGVSVHFTTAFQSGRYAITQVKLDNVADTCRGRPVSVTLTNAGAEAGSGSSTVATGTSGVNLTTINVASPPAAKDVDGVHVVIS